jgi:Aspartyl protease
LYSIGSAEFSRALCELGASVSLISKLVFNRIDVGELVSTKISLQLVYMSVRQSLGKVKILSIRVDKIYLPIDFVIIKMEENPNKPFVLGRSFLVIVGTHIDVKNDRIKLEIDDEVKFFVIYKTVKISY